MKLAGSHFFCLEADSIDAATDKEQLRPDWDVVEQNSGVISHGERVFLYALCAFYNSEWAGELSARYGETGNVGDLARLISRERSSIITDLMASFRGW